MLVFFSGIAAANADREDALEEHMLVFWDIRPVHLATFPTCEFKLTAADVNVTTEFWGQIRS